MQTATDTQIRIASVKDAALLSYAARISFYAAFADTSDPDDIANYLSEAFSFEQVTAELSDSNNYFFIMETAKHDVSGYAKLIARKTHQCLPPHSQWWQLHRFYLMPDYIGKGGALLLMNALKDFVYHAGGYGIWLATWTENKRAIRFYEKCGFEICGNDKFIMGKTVTCDYVMKWIASKPNQ